MTTMELDTTDRIFYDIADCRLGKVLVARREAGVCAILLGDSAEALESDLAARQRR